MTPRHELVITDLDNTLYDWVTFFAKSFQAMLSSLAKLLEVGEPELINEFKLVHQRYQDSEQPFAILELPSVRARFSGLDRLRLTRELDEPLHAFNRERKQHLRLYDSVANTMRVLSRYGITIVGHTEASMVNAYYRLKWLGIEQYFHRLYVRARLWDGHPDPDREQELQPPSGLVRTLLSSERKPNPSVLRDICDQEGFSVRSAWYVGDSLTRDVSMAKLAGAKAVWARYGTLYEEELWTLLVAITHWSEEDVRFEEEVRKRFDRIQPDYVIDSFSEVLPIIGIPPPYEAGSTMRSATSAE
jgi:phosphoglycolate phosphatase-like HAD superfamily hydrolase